SARLAEELKKLGFEVTTGVGGHGVVAVLENGKGPTVLVRTDMDALPVTEQTGLSYASKVRVRDKAGNDVGVMHACGHDMHMTCWDGTARGLAGVTRQGRGRRRLTGQPPELLASGRRARLDAALLKRFPRPDSCRARHCAASQAHGHIAYTDGLALANVDSVDTTVRGKG